MAAQNSRNDSFIPLLLSQIELRFNKKILYFSDCIALSSELNSLNISVSAHTIARLFKIVKSNGSPYKATLDLLVKYLGYDNFVMFCSSRNLAGEIAEPFYNDDAQARILCFDLFKNFIVTGNDLGIIKAEYLPDRNVVIDLYHHKFPVVELRITNDYLVYEDCNNSIFILRIKGGLLV